MKPKHPKLTEECRPVSEFLARIGDKWSVLVVSLLGGGSLRFSELRRRIDGISQKMLTATLRSLERDGFVTRTVYPTVPPRVEYELTSLGLELLVPVGALADWARSNQARVDAARADFDLRDSRNASATAKPGERPRASLGAQ